MSFLFPQVGKRILAQDQEMLKPHVEVDHIAGRVEKLGEKIALLLKFYKKSKADYYQYLLEKRLAELVYVVENDQINSVEETASRYSTYLGILANYVETKRVVEKKEDILSTFDRHSRVVENLQKKFKYESGWWLAIAHDINSLKLFKEKIQNL